MKSIILTLVLAVASFSSQAGLILVEFSGQFDPSTSPVSSINGNFTYNDVSLEVIDVDLNVNGFVHTTNTVGVKLLSGDWIFGGLVSGINGLGSNDNGDFWLSPGSVVNGQQLNDFTFADGSSIHNDILFSVTINETQLEIPEPSSIAILALGLLLACSRNFLK